MTVGGRRRSFRWRPEGGKSLGVQPRGPQSANPHLKGRPCQGLAAVVTEMEDAPLTFGQASELGGDEHLQRIVLATGR